MRKTLSGLLALAAWLAPALAWALDLTVQKVTDGVYALVGPYEQRSAENLANNATFGVVVTDAGVVLMDPGGSYRGAAAVETAIRTVTDKPVKLVINTGGQDHRWLGNGYFKERGARIVASADAVADHKARTTDHFFMLTNLMGKEALAGTEAVYADETFDDALDIDFGGARFEIRHTGAAHTPGDAFVWLPERSVMFTGDIVYVERMLGVIPVSNTQTWLESFDAMAARQPKFIVPGHGPVTDLARARAETYDYLTHLRAKVGQVLESGGGENEAVDVDQSAFAHLKVFDEISRRNALALYMQMEFE
ncbi:MAG: MBL fold metallo-hydrolase [Alphaproteobacteria bacterium]|nr:MBL fold metallo-hydrolase [Alphaproteobacteria bacterium]